MDKTFRKTRLKNKEYDWMTYQVNHNWYFKNAIPVIGYCFDFSDVLKTFLVLQYQQWHEYKALDKTSLRVLQTNHIK